MRLLTLLLFIGFYSCGQKTQNKKHPINPEARILNDSAASVIRYSKDYEKAILLYDEAINIDSNYSLAIGNKLLCQVVLKQYDNALVTAKKMNRMNPEAPGSYLTIGILYEDIHDTLNSKINFDKALIFFDKVLDTMNTKNKTYENVLMNKAIDLLLVGEQQKGNDILKQLYDKQPDELHKYGFSVFMNQTRQYVIDHYFNRN